MTLYLGKKAVCPTKIVVKEVPARVNNQDITVVENGTYTADEGYTGLGTVEVNVPTGGGGGEPVTKTKYGVSIDDFLGDVDENGWLYKPTTPFALGLAGVKRILSNVFFYRFYSDKNITGADFGTVVEIDSTGLQYAFYGCKNLTYANFAALESVESNGLQNAFRDTGLTTLSFPALKRIGLAGFEHGVRDCTALTSIDFSALETVEQGAFRYAFQGTALTSISFPALTNVDIAAFQQAASSAISGAFRNAPTLTEIHFRADAQAAIEAIYGYSSKWGATNATIYFDL